MNKKKILKIIIASSAIAGGITLSNSVVYASEGKGKVVNVSSSLNVRAEAGTQYDVITHLKNGQEVEICGEVDSWYKINIDGKIGYVSKEYIERSNSNINNAGENSASGTGHVVNVSSSLNIRQSASTSSAIVGTLKNGQSFNIIGKSGGWYHIQVNGVTGYVSGEYVQEGVGSTTQAPSTGNSISGTGHVVNVSSSLNIRQSASTSSAIVGTLKNGQSFNIIGKSGGWYHIQVNGVTGYVSGEYVQEGAGSSINTESTSSGKGKVVNVSTNLRVRSAANTSSSVLGYLLNGQYVDIVGKSSGWVHIKFNNTTGYVSSEYIVEVSADESTNSNHGTASFQQVFEVMKQHIGSPYVWGGSGEYLTTASLNSLKKTYPIQAAAGMYNRAAQYVDRGFRAFDCSGLMQWGFKQVGINIGRSTWDQINNGYEVSVNALQPGDLLFYSNLQHVGMYIGNGQWIESPNSSADVRIATVPWSKIGRARRIL